jgi:hypothetical protein
MLAYAGRDERDMTAAMQFRRPKALGTLVPGERYLRSGQHVCRNSAK